LRENVSDTATAVRSTVRGEFADSVDGVARTIDSIWRLNKSVWIFGDTLFLTDGGADTNWVCNRGDYLLFSGDNSIFFNNVVFSTHIMPAGGDTLRYVGDYDERWKEVWGLRHYWTSPDAADSGKIYDSGDSSFIATDNPFVFTKDVRFNENIYADSLRGEVDTTAVGLAAALGNRLTETGTVPLTADFAAGDFDITGLERLEADSVEATVALGSNKWICGLGGSLGSGEILGLQVTVPKMILTDTLKVLKVQNITTAITIDSFKLNAGTDTLLFFVGGKRFKAGS